MLAAPAPTVSFKLTMAEATELLTINFITDEPVTLDAHINVKSLMLAYIVPNGLAPHTRIVYPSHEYCPAKLPIQAQCQSSSHPLFPDGG